MFALGIRYLTGRSVATHPADRERAEWPPHPDRVFMALVAAWGETGRASDEEAALRWLESLDAPEIVASGEGAVSRRELVTSYVPVNDIAAPRLKAGRAPSRDQIAAGLALLPEFRSRQPRHFPTVTPASEIAYLRWSATVATEHRAALEALCRKVAYLGHSASLVQCWLVGAEQAASLKPVLRPRSVGAVRSRLRVAVAGRLDNLEARFKAGLRPTASTWIGYETSASENPMFSASTTCFTHELLVLRQLSGRTLSLSATLQISRALRDTFMAKCSLQPPPEWLSGHAQGGAPSESDHLAFLPLPHVGREHADGHLLGLAIAVPRGVPAEEQARSWRGLLFDDLGTPLPLELRLGSLGVLTVELDDREQRPVALQPETWTASDNPARRWATVTPIALDRHPKGPEPWAEIEARITASCERIGLKALVESVILSPVSLFIGAPTSRNFPNLQRKSGGNIHHTHAIITFKQPVIGPVLVGAGRYRGYGLCRPLRDKEAWT